MTRTSAEAFEERVAPLVERRTGLSCVGAGMRRLEQAVRETFPAGPPAETGESLSEDDLGRLCNAMTVQESYFFREPDKLLLLRDRLLAPARSRRTPLQIWSAGCAGGEEAYTLAALCREAGLTDQYRILGTDLSPAAVTAARRAEYAGWSLRGLDRRRLTTLFEYDGLRYRVVDRVRENVSFAQHNLTDPLPEGRGSLDLVVCRNVLIYLTPAAVRGALVTMADALAPGGWLVLGASDPLVESCPRLEPVPTPHGLLYRRRPFEEPPAPPPVTRSQLPAPRTPQPAAFRPAVTRRDVTDAPVPDRDVLAGAAERELAAGRPVEAEKHARSLLRAFPRDRTAHHLLVQSLAEQGRPAEAVATAGRAVALFPEDAESRHMQALALLERGDAQAAAAAARQAVYLDPGLAPAHLVLARVQELLGNTAAAERARRHGQRLLTSRVG